MGRFCILSFLILLINSLYAPVSGVGLSINEVYYDHPGTDTGHEFVELYNAGVEPVPLAGVTLEFHNGSGTGWVVLWAASGADSVPPRSVFTIGADEVRPLPDVVLALSLQNGPDALALFRSGVALDVVGYGGLDDPDYVETAAVARVAAGRSIARIPDGRDRDDNASDFTDAAPTPGRTNVARHDAALALPAGVPLRAVVEPGPLGISVEIHNHGTDAIDAGAVRLGARDSTGLVVVDMGSWRNNRRIAPGDSGTVDVTLALDRGYHWIGLRADYDRDERAHNNEIELLRRAGSPALLVSEVLSAPREGCPQFVEIYNAGAAAVDMAGFGIRDRTHDPVPFDLIGTVLDPGAFAVVVPDAAALRSCFDAGAAPVRAVDGSWPTVNRTGGEVADSVVIVDGYGLAVDAVAVPGIPSNALGRSLERVALYPGAGVTWVLSQEASGASPGRAGERALRQPPALGAVDVRPNPYVPSEGLMTVSIDAPAGARVVAAMYDPSGRRVVSLGVATAFPAVLVWNGRDAGGDPVRPGLYILACVIEEAGATRVVREVVGCAGG